MKEEQIQKLLNELGTRISEPVPPGLGEEIKREPHRLSRHKSAEHGQYYNRFQLSKSVAAAVIIITMISAEFIRRPGLTGE
jgi:hypothetical protein